MGISKKYLDDLIEKGGVGSRTARKLHKANGTEGAPAEKKSVKPRGHGPASARTPVLGNF